MKLSIRRRGERPTCSRCGKKNHLGAFKRTDDGVCRTCVRTAKEAAALARPVPVPTLPTIDVIIGREAAYVPRDRLVRVQRVDRLLRLTSAVRLDATAIHSLGTFTIPLRHVAELQKALTALGAAKPPH